MHAMRGQSGPRVGSYDLRQLLRQVLSSSVPNGANSKKNKFDNVQNLPDVDAIYGRVGKLQAGNDCVRAPDPRVMAVRRRLEWTAENDKRRRMRTAKT
jgi:hypothetical protein